MLNAYYIDVENNSTKHLQVAATSYGYQTDLLPKAKKKLGVGDGQYFPLYCSIVDGQGSEMKFPPCTINLRRVEKIVFRRYKQTDYTIEIEAELLSARGSLLETVTISLQVPVLETELPWDSLLVFKPGKKDSYAVQLPCQLTLENVKHECVLVPLAKTRSLNAYGFTLPANLFTKRDCQYCQFVYYDDRIELWTGSQRLWYSDKVVYVNKQEQKRLEERQKSRTAQYKQHHQDTRCVSPSQSSTPRRRRCKKKHQDKKRKRKRRKKVRGVSYTGPTGAHTTPLGKRR